MRRIVWPLLALVAVVGILVLLVFPGRTYLAQRHSLQAAQHRLAVLTKENDSLDAKAKSLQTDGEIEQIARRDYGMVKPGEEAYAILPAPKPAVSAKPVAKPKPHGNVFARAWNAIF